MVAESIREFGVIDLGRDRKHLVAEERLRHGQ